MGVRLSEKPAHIKDRQGRRCEADGGPTYKQEGKERTHKCVLYDGHPGKLHYCFIIDPKNGQISAWYEWDA